MNYVLSLRFFCQAVINLFPNWDIYEALIYETEHFIMQKNLFFFSFTCLIFHGNIIIKETLVNALDRCWGVSVLVSSYQPLWGLPPLQSHVAQSPSFWGPMCSDCSGRGVKTWPSRPSVTQLWRAILAPELPRGWPRPSQLSISFCLSCAVTSGPQGLISRGLPNKHTTTPEPASWRDQPRTTESLHHAEPPLLHL